MNEQETTDQISAAQEAQTVNSRSQQGARLPYHTPVLTHLGALRVETTGSSLGLAYPDGANYTSANHG